MLRTKDDQATPRTWKSRLALTAVLGMAALILFGLYALAVDPSSRKDGSKEHCKTCKVVNRPAFDLSYLPEDATSVIAFRPAAFFAQPGMEKIARMANVYFAKQCGLHVEDIEQVVGEFTINVSHTKKSSGPSKKASGKKSCDTDEHSVCFGTKFNVLLRTTKDADWEKILQSHGVKLKKMTYQGKTYCQLKVPQNILRLLDDKDHRGDKLSLCMYCPDRRTLVISSEPAIQGILKRGRDFWPHGIDKKDWQSINKGIIACLISDQKDAFKSAAHELTTGTAENSDKSSGKDGTIDTERKINKDLADVICCARSLAFGLDMNKNDFAFQFLVRCKSTDKVQIAVPAVKDLAAIAADEAKELCKNPADTEEEKMLKEFIIKLIRETHIDQQGAVVRVHTSSTLNLPRLVALEMASAIKGPKISNKSSKAPQATPCKPCPADAPSKNRGYPPKNN